MHRLILVGSDSALSYLLFIDESGHDKKDSPYEVLAGVAIEDKELWPLIKALHALEITCFGQRYAEDERELKGKKILKRKVFRHAAQAAAIEPDKRAELARACLQEGSGATREQITALAQSKIAFVRRSLHICASHGGKAFASIVTRDAPRPIDDDAALRKDYAYLFERFYYFVRDQGEDARGLVVFDELERTQSHLLVSQMNAYFTEYQAERSEVVIPEPFFVHSHLTTGVQLADLVAYIAAWGLQVGSMPTPERGELADLGEAVGELEYHTVVKGHRFKKTQIHSLWPIDDLRPARERRPRKPRR